MIGFLDDAKVVVRWWWSLWGARPRLLSGIVLGSVVTAALWVLFPWLWQYVIDRVHDDTEPVELFELCGWLLGAGLAHAVAYTALQGARGWGNAIVAAEARERVLDAITEASPDALRAWRTGNLVSRLHDDAGDKVAWFLCSGVFRAWESLLVAVGCFVAMLLSEPMLALWVVGPLPVLLVAQALAQSGLSRGHARVQRAVADVADQLTTTFSSVRVVQACGLEPLARVRFREAVDAQRRAEVRVAVLQQALQLLYAYGWQVGMVALLWFGGQQVMADEMTLGRYITFEGLLAAMVWPMFDVGTLASKLPQTAVSLRRLDAVRELPPAERRVEAATPGVEGRQITLTGADGSVLVEDVSVVVGPGRRVALVGEVGAGKTLVLEALSGLRGVARGEVAGARVAVVPQVPVLLSDTVRANVLLGRDVTPGQLERALEISQLARDLPGLAAGLDTRVGERGTQLSGGQRQRVAIARALVGDPAVLLLDDATSALDAEVEAAFWAALVEALPEVGVLLVTHRVGTLAGVDEIVVLERGRVAQRGRHAELVEGDGTYHRLYGMEGA